MLAAAVVAMTTACGSDGGCETVDPGGPLPFHLHVSNQSFDFDPVDIAVIIDGLAVVCGDFYVEGQHNWILFDLGLDPGHHQIRALGNEGSVTLEEEFDLETEGWAAVDYWSAANEPPDRLNFFVDDQPIAFA